VHARTKLVDVYDVRPVNAEEERLPFGPYNYPTFPPLNQDSQRVAVDNELSPSDVPDISQLVTVDIESISGSARRGSRDCDSDSGSENIRKIELESGSPQEIVILDTSRDDSEDCPAASDHQGTDDVNQDDQRSCEDDTGAAGPDFVSIEGIVAQLKLSEDSAIGDAIDTNCPQASRDAEEAKSSCGSSQDSSHDPTVGNERSPSRIPSGEAVIELRPGGVFTDASEDDSSGSSSSGRVPEVAGDDDGLIDGDHR
jgi:hypothetical protein